MIDTLGLLTIGELNDAKNGIFLYNDGSFCYGYKLPGFPWFQMTTKEKIMVYAKFRDLLNYLEEFYKGEGSIYQIVSQKNYNWYKEKERIKKNVLIEYDKFYFKYNPKTKRNEPVSPKFLQKVLERNVEDFFKIVENLGIYKLEHYFFVKSKVNFNKYKLNFFEILKNTFLGIDEKKELKLIDAILEQKVKEHNSKLSTIFAEPLTLLEMVNVIRKYFGFSEIDYIPNDIYTKENIYKLLFPGKIEYTKEDYIRTEEKIFVNKDKILYLDEQKNRILKLIENQREKDYKVLKSNNIEKENMLHDLKIIYCDLFKFPLPKFKSINIEDLFLGLKQDIKEIIKKMPDEFYKHFRYFNKDIFKIYLTEVSEKLNNIYKKETYLKVFSAYDLPENFSLNHGINLHNMNGDYTITINFKKLNKDEVQLKMRRQIVLEGLKISMPVMKWFMPIEAIQEKINLMRSLQIELEEAEFSRVETNFYLTLRSDTAMDYREKTEMGQYETITKLKWMKEVDAVEFHILKGAMPTGPTNTSMNVSKRNLIINTTNVAQIAPFLKEDQGADSFTLPFIGHLGIIGVDLRKEPAGHFSIQGGTGGGKSVLGNKIAVSYKALGETVVVTEKGNSFGRSALFFGGKKYRPDISGKIKFNPFVMPIAAFENNDKEEAKEIRTDSYMQMIAALKQMTNNFEPEVEQIYYRILKKAFEVNGKINTRYVTNYSVTPTKLYQLMKIDPDMKNMKKELHSFERFTASGPYGKIFDGNEGLSMNYPYIHIDYSGLDNLTSIKDFVFKSLLQNIFFEMSRSKGRRFLNINDEFWDAIKTSETSKNVVGTAMEQVEAFFRVARKLGGSIGVISQSIQDIAESPIKNAVLSNIFHTFFTTTLASEITAIKDLFKLEDDQIEDIVNLSSKKGFYSEYYLTLPSYAEPLPGNANLKRTYSTKFRYYPTPLEYALFTTFPEEISLYNYMYELMGSTGPGLETQDMVIRAVRLFMLLFPNGILNNNEFVEILYRNKNDVFISFKHYVETVFGKNIKQVLKEISWKDYIIT